MIQINTKQKWATRKMQRQLKKMYGKYMYGMLLAYFIDSTMYWLGRNKEDEIKNITLSFNGGNKSTLDLEKNRFYHPEFEQ